MRGIETGKGRGEGKGRERGREKDRVREDRNKDRDRGREGDRDGRRARSRDEDKDNESYRLSRRQNYDRDEDGYRDRDNDFRHRRNSEDYHREGPRKSDLENESSKNKQNERGNENLERYIVFLNKLVICGFFSSNSSLCVFGGLGEDDGQEDYQDKIAMQLAEQEEDDLEKIKEESRRRRQAILEKYKNQHQQRETHSQDMVKDQVGESSAQVTYAEVLSEKTDNRVEVADIYVPEPSFSVGKSPSQNGLSALQMPTGTGGLGEGSPKGKGDGVAVEKSGLHDNWDDAEGYYGYRFGEVLDGRYEIIAAHGKGVFSTVVRAKDLKAKPGDPEEVAIKIIRNKKQCKKLLFL
ncbi:hypothetical protein DH2020_011904 [Rehmannia glutinosa]|uniref:Protein kinase domain-containing protein n=1 Tax=Rehmannia glutinosa TaxID=99300 RepID=A0ABR0XET9_REHGL